MAAPDGAVLAVEDLSVSIRVPGGIINAVSNVGIIVGRGKTHCIVGESGSGKSVTAYALMGLLPRNARWSAGRLCFDGREITAGSSEIGALRGAGLAMVFQEPMTALNPTYRIGTQLEDVCMARRAVGRRAARAMVAELLARVGLEPAAMRMAQFPHQLSGGQRQRVLIAMALLCDPKVLIADEPTTALDVTVQAEILRLMISLQAEFGLGMLFITHDIGLVSRIADWVSVMYAGRIVESGTTREVLGAPAHPYTRALLASVPKAGAERQQRIPSIRGSVPSLLEKIPGCAFRSRCSHAVPACAEPVPVRGTRGSHSFSCVLERALA